MADISAHNNLLADTHEVLNQPRSLEDYNLYEQDIALREAVQREGAAWAEEQLQQFGRLTGSRVLIELGFQANENRPVLYTHDRYGHRVDEVRFHPAYHCLMQVSFEHGLHASHWIEPGPGAQVARAARFYMMTQVEAAHCCPVTMTSAAIPALRTYSALAAEWEPRILAFEHDPRNVPAEHKRAVTVGMAMTEKQGGSDVRSNATRALPAGQRGPGQRYLLVGHKYFVSAPMCDLFLVLAQAPGGLSCFLLPRWCQDGRKNPLQIQRLKNKMGNVANATAETELRGAEAFLIGEEGRGAATILKMVAQTRFDCMVGSAAGMRQATAQALHHCSRRHAFGRPLIDQPLMENVLADLAIESEAALVLVMRIARALDAAHANEAEQLLARVGTAIGKYWICKRTPGHAYEAMECIGGSGVMEDCIMPRLFRESPVNAIWEGSGNVQCLDVLRVLKQKPACLEAFAAELQAVRGQDPRLDRHVASLLQSLRSETIEERTARAWVAKMAIAMQAGLLVRSAPAYVADAFCASRLDATGTGRLFGDLPNGLDFASIIRRATPQC